ncbi:MAG TPA: hypothetical protein VGI34_06055, partial [Candidatus Acidoferrales bacterium]
VLILQRAVADAPQGPEENSQPSKADTSAGQPANQGAKQEDWLLVMRALDSTPNGVNLTSAGIVPTQVKRSTSDSVSGGPDASQMSAAAMDLSAGPVAGWVLARFIELDLPDPVKDYASSADLHVVAWFELNRVPDGSGGQAPQYLVAGSRGAEGGPCDFTMLRVYTWGTARKRYETAYVESDLCGRLPIHVSTSAKGPSFQFPDVDEGGAERSYVLSSTTVRWVKDAETQPSAHAAN